MEDIFHHVSCRQPVDEAEMILVGISIIYDFCVDFNVCR